MKGELVPHLVHSQSLAKSSSTEGMTTTKQGSPVCLSVSVSMCLTVCLSVWVSDCLSVCLSVCLGV